MKSATRSISSRSSVSASRSATSAASSELRRSLCADAMSDERIASDRVIPADSRARRARSASSSNRTEIAGAMIAIVSRIVRQIVPIDERHVSGRDLCP